MSSNETMYDTTNSLTARGYPNRPCCHVKCEKPFDGKDNKGVTWKNYCDFGEAESALSNTFDWAIQKTYLPLDFQKNDDFQLGEALADLDGTIAMFGEKMLKSLRGTEAYGAVTWGILPFLSDVRSLANTLSDLFNNGIANSFEKSNGKRIARRFPISRKTAYWSFSGTLRLNGRISYNDSSLPSLDDYLPILLDELGVHPDLATLWQIVPLSFVVDYFVPVGSYLESLHPRGWFNPVCHFSGMLSMDGTLTSGLQLGRTQTWSCYIRDTRSLTLGSRAKMREIPWEPPSLVEGLNTAYLALSSRK